MQAQLVSIMRRCRPEACAGEAQPDIQAPGSPYQCSAVPAQHLPACGHPCHRRSPASNQRSECVWRDRTGNSGVRGDGACNRCFMGGGGHSTKPCMLCSVCSMGGAALVYTCVHTMHGGFQRSLMAPARNLTNLHMHRTPSTPTPLASAMTGVRWRGHGCCFPPPAAPLRQWCTSWVMHSWVLLPRSATACSWRLWPTGTSWWVARAQ